MRAARSSSAGRRRRASSRSRWRSRNPPTTHFTNQTPPCPPPLPPTGGKGPGEGGITAIPVLGGLIALASSLPLFAQTRAIPFWPDDVPASIHREVDGVAALETVRELGRFHRVQGSPGFAAAAELMRKKAAAAGLSDAAIERFPADGTTKYAHFRSHVGWDPVSG